MEMLSTLNEASVESLDGLKESTNKQKNQAVLDNLGENSNGQLTYKGSPIGQPSLIMKEAVSDWTSGLIWSPQSQIMSIEIADLPRNARVKKVEIPDIVNGTDEYILLEDMISKDPEYQYTAPYFIMYPKNAVGEFPIAAIVSFQGVGSFLTQAANYGFFEKSFKVYYEIEE